MTPDDARTVYEGKLVDVTIERWGEHEREIVEHAESVAIVAVDREQQVWLVSQFRETARKQLLELPAGVCEEGEDPLASARRELREECGLRGGSWTQLASFWTTPGFCRERMHLFLAEDLEPGEADPDDDEEVDVVRWPAAEVVERIAELEDAKTIAGLLLYLQR
jgi:ADP-ribose pyrophosphatase